MSFYSCIFFLLILPFLASMATYSSAATPADLRGIGITARDNVTGTNREVKLYRQMHAVIIGSDKYQNLSPDQQLAYAVKDAKGVEDVLREQYSFDNIYTLYNEQATKNGIMELLQGKLSNAHKDDAVFIFFAGHGITQKDNLTGGDLGYILPLSGAFYGLGDFVFIPSAQKRALEIEKERKHLEDELVRLDVQEKSVEAAKVQQERNELEQQKKALETKQRIEELRQQKIAEAKKREEEQLKEELEARKQSEEKMKQEEERLAHLKIEVETTDVEVLVVSPAIREAVYQPGITVICEDNWLISGKHCMPDYR